MMSNLSLYFVKQDKSDSMCLARIEWPAVVMDGNDKHLDRSMQSSFNLTDVITGAVWWCLAKALYPWNFLKDCGTGHPLFSSFAWQWSMYHRVLHSFVNTILPVSKTSLVQPLSNVSAQSIKSQYNLCGPLIFSLLSGFGGSFNVCCADIMMAKAFVFPDKVCSRVASETCETLTLYSMYLQLLKSLQSFNCISIVISIPSVSFGCSLILILEMLS